LSYQDKNTFLKKIDSLPEGPAWKCHTFVIQSDLLDYNGELLKEEVDLWYRNPEECVRELIGNPSFRSVLRYAPEKLFADKELTEEIINEIWTAEWWWDLQVCLVILICPSLFTLDFIVEITTWCYHSSCDYCIGQDSTFIV